MPLEIRELHIQVNVGKKNEASQQGETTKPAQNDSNSGDVIKQCVEEVMNIINQQKER